MDFTLSEQQQSIRDAIARICAKFDDAYWLKKDESGEFPHELYEAIARDGWLGICIPEAYGGSGLGLTEAAVMMQAIAESGAGMSGASAVHRTSSPEPCRGLRQRGERKRMLPPLSAAEEKACFAVTEPNTGLNTTQLKTRAVRKGEHYVVNGAKVWISTAQQADKMLLLARTTPLEEVKKHTDGLSLFYTDLDRGKVDVKLIHKMGRAAVDSNELFIDGLQVPVEDRIGEEGRGFEYILHGMNPERMLIAAEAWSWARGPGARQRIFAGAHRLRPPHRQEPGDPAPARRLVDGAGSANLMVFQRRRSTTAACPAARRPTPPSTGRRGGLQGLHDGRHDARRLRLRQGVPRRALPARGDDPAHRPGQPAARALLHRGEGARAAEVVLGAAMAGLHTVLT